MAMIQIHPKSIQIHPNPSKIHPKSIHILHLGVFNNSGLVSIPPGMETQLNYVALRAPQQHLMHVAYATEAGHLLMCGKEGQLYDAPGLWLLWLRMAIFLWWRGVIMCILLLYIEIYIYRQHIFSIMFIVWFSYSYCCHCDHCSFLWLWNWYKHV